MKESMTEYCLSMAIEVVLLYANLIMLGICICKRWWWDVAFFAAFVVLFVASAIISYKRAKRIEESMHRNIK